MKRFIPIPGDLIIVDVSEWYALKDGERLRVCEAFDWTEIGEEIRVVPRHQASTFWGPSFGEPDGYKPMLMSTSGGPFKSVKIKELEGLTLVEETEDTFWHWQDVPRAAGGAEYTVKVALWRLPLLPDEHYRKRREYGLETHRDRIEAESGEGN